MLLRAPQLSCSSIAYQIFTVTLFTRVHSWCCMFYGLWQQYNVLTRVSALKNLLCSTCSSFSPVPAPVCADLFFVSIVLLFPDFCVAPIHTTKPFGWFLLLNNVCSQSLVFFMVWHEVCNMRAWPLGFLSCPVSTASSPSKNHTEFSISYKTDWPISSGFVLALIIYINPLSLSM